MNRTARTPNFAPTALAVAISLISVSLHAADLPTGGNIVGGSGSISQDGNSLNVQQNSDKLITNWDSFDIGAGNTVNFYQPGSNSVALNRVIGEDASAIYGNLNANGKVFLVNPNGVLFGEGAAVNVGALVASTLSLSDQDFNDGNYQFSGDGNNAAVINRGSITADGGAVALLGGQVRNHGIIQANQGTVALAAGDKITLDFAGDGLLNVTVDEGTLNALVENHQLVRANGGHVVMTASATNALLQTVVNNTGIIEAQTLDNQSGTIVLKGGFNGGTVNVAGTLDASAPDSGDGGFIDTSGAHVKIAGGTQVTTKANNGSTGEWLIDPTDFYITDSSDPQTDSGIGAATLSANLEDSNITLATIEAGTDAGDIHVDAAVSWNANTTLSLSADNNILINAPITVENSGGGVALNYGGSHYQMNAPISFTAGSGGAFSVNGQNFTLIHSIAQLQNINTALDGHYALATNIDASETRNWNSGKGFNPIGYYDTFTPSGSEPVFTGTMNGLGHTINNLTINRADESQVGLFRTTGSDSVIRSIGLVDANVAGAFAVGGLVGQNKGEIIQSYVSGTVSGTVLADGQPADNIQAALSGMNVGGLAGINNGSITQSHATSSVNGASLVGGLVGYNTYKISQSYATGMVNGKNQVGGLVGYTNGTVAQSYATGMVSGIDQVGGLAGYLGFTSKISQSYATGAVTGVNDVGGLVGGNSNLRDLTNNTTSEIEEIKDVGGNITQSYATGTVTGENNVGGLVGFNDGTSSQNYATGMVIGKKNVGGLAGVNARSSPYEYNISISQSYATGSVTSDSFIGGLVGYNKVNATISRSYASGLINGKAETNLASGILLGLDDYSAMKTPAELQQLDTFAGWDINAEGGTDSVWRLYEGHTAPLLRSFLTALEVSTQDTTVTYNGSEQSGSWSANTPYDAALVLGNPTGGKNAGTYALDLSGLYSGQQGYDLITTGSGTLTINKAQATVTANSNTTTYNGTEQSISGFTVDGLVNGEDQSVLSDVTTSGGKGTNAGSYTLTASGSDGNYELSFVDGTLTINKAQATVTANSGTTTYNGSEQSVSGFTVDGLVNGEDQSVLSGVTTSGGKGTNAGSYTLTASGSDGNYELTFVDGTLTINKAQATVTANSNTTTYNGTEQSISGFTVDGLVNGEDQSVLSDVTTSGGKGTNAGSYTLTASGSDGNYELTFVDGTLTINKAQATVTANSGTTTYNGSEQSVSGFTVDGLVNGEDQSVLTGVTTSGGKGTNAGSYTLTASGSDGNYELTFVDGTLTINKAQATVTANSGTTTYNGTEQSVSGFTVEGLVNGENQSVLTGVTTNGGKGTNAGSYTLTASGSDGNYELSFVDGTLTINKAQATVTANSGTTTYNGTEQSVSGFTVEGLVNGEDASVLSGVSTSGGKGTNAGSYTLTASGSDGNYELTFVDGALTINKAQATVTANSGTTTYNGNEQSVSGFTVEGLVNGEDASVLSGVTTNGGKGTNAGSYELTASGTDGNYELTFVDGKLTINKAQATVTANSGTTTYNGTEQSVSGFTVEGLVNDEDASVLTGVTTSGGKGTNAGSYTLTASGADGNYELTFVDGTLTINKAQATVTANSGTTTYNGTEQSVSGFTVEGLVNGENQSVLTGVTTNGGKGTNAGSYTLTASGSDGNYELTFVDGKLTINKALATVTANSGTTTYNGTEQSISGFTVDGLVNGEDASVLTGVTTSGGKGTNAGSYTLAASGSDGNYELTFFDGTLTIDRKTITADVRALDKLFDGSFAATLEGVLNGTISGDDVALQLSGLFTSLTPGENRVLVEAALTGADAGNYRLIAPSEVIARLLGFVQSADYLAAMDSQRPQPPQLNEPGDEEYQQEVDDDALHLPMASR
ncbi:MBG domain-containing protein [Halopseudomonas oceani]|uniref:beta strand repeat-containing protein n=1 Tax=Halopseudomonas oceani TaxID=1708783 RepID=UPI002AA8D71B|nr:MBG domain-containing protein [Halopseudomonas oceani]